MRKKTKYFGLIVAFVMLSGFTMHKFYVSIYQINYAPEKKMLQITSRIFIDDINDALEYKYGKKTALGDQNETVADVTILQQYLTENFLIKVNGQQKPIRFISHEFENNVIICYFTVKDVAKIKTIEVRNAALFELFPDQQHIINTIVLGKKESLLLTIDKKSGVLKYE